MASLTGTKVSDTYQQLLKLTSQGVDADASAKYIEDGLGTDTALSLSTTRVGIGTASPSSKLHIYSSAANEVRIERTTSGNAGIHYKNTNDDWYAGITSQQDFSISQNADIASGTEFRIQDETGNIGIGTDSPDTLLNLKDTGGIEVRLEADSNNSGQEDCFIRFYTDGKTQEGIVGMDNNNSSTLFSGNTENAMVFGCVSNLPVDICYKQY